MKGKHVPGSEDLTNKGMSMKSENVLRKSSLVMVGPHRFKKSCHLPVFRNLSVPLLHSLSLLNEQATLGG